MRQINIHRSEVYCGRAFEPGGSGLPYYCTPPVCVPAVLGAPAVWRFSKKKKLGHGGASRDLQVYRTFMSFPLSLTVSHLSVGTYGTGLP